MSDGNWAFIHISQFRFLHIASRLSHNLDTAGVTVARRTYCFFLYDFIYVKYYPLELTFYNINTYKTTHDNVTA